MKKVKEVPVIKRAKAQIEGCASMFDILKQKVILGGLSEATYHNYGRCIAKISLHYAKPAIELDETEINGFLQHLLIGERPSKSYFKHTVYGLRFLFRAHNLQDKIVKLPSLKNEYKLPVVLSTEECMRLFKAPRLLKHRVLLSLIYSAGLRSREVRRLKLSDVDYDRMQIHIRQTKYDKDRYVPLSSMMARGLKKYIAACQPREFLFNGQSPGKQLSPKGVSWAMREARKAAGITKEATVHTLRHSYATHLLEMGVDIDTLSKLLGHASLQPTMIYLHVARLGGSQRFSPLDRLYNKG